LKIKRANNHAKEAKKNLVVAKSQKKVMLHGKKS